MKNRIFTPTSVESAVAEVDLFRNDILGPAAFLAGLTALQFSDPSQQASIGTVALIFVSLWGYSKAPLYMAAHDRFYRQFGLIRGVLVAFVRNPVLFLGVAFLALVAMGYITSDTFSGLSLARVFGPVSAHGA